jgi:hypothetical protein
VRRSAVMRFPKETHLAVQVKRVDSTDQSIP